jgi:hypothetical protein
MSARTTCKPKVYSHPVTQIKFDGSDWTICSWPYPSGTLRFKEDTGRVAIAPMSIKHSKKPSRHATVTQICGPMKCNFSGHSSMIRMVYIYKATRKIRCDTSPYKLPRSPNANSLLLQGYACAGSTTTESLAMT